MISEFTSIQKAYPVSAIAMGTFDGVHAGHQRIISCAVELSRQLSGKSMVFTSVNHPLSSLLKDKCPRSLTKSQEKAGLISNLGIDCLAQIVFTPEILSISPEKFIDHLCRRFEPKCIVVGSNYTFGHGGAGNIDTLQKFSRRYGYHLEVPDSVYWDGVMVSSTMIRKLISTGSLAIAEHMLKRPVQLTAYVEPFEMKRCVPGDCRVLVKLEDDMAVPRDGLYNVGIFTDNACEGGGLCRLSRAVSLISGILRIELQFFGSLNELSIPKMGCFAKLVFTEIVSGEMAASEG